MEINSKLWDSLWKKETSLVDVVLGKIYYAQIWKGYKRFLLEIDIDNPSILELGCGTGRMTLYLLKFFGNGNAVLVDFSEEALKIAKKPFLMKDLM